MQTTFDVKKMKKIAILQSNYIPWKGYFDMINMVDEFILYDTEQYTRRDWRNRNLIKTSNNTQWLTIPVRVKGKYLQRINETKVADNKWRKKHWAAIKNSYSKSPYFKKYIGIFEELYMNSSEILLSKINYNFIHSINKILGINTKITWSSDYEIKGKKTEKLLNICKQAGAIEYLSGPAAINYLDEKLFEQENIKVSWMDYSSYPEYNQLFPPFEHAVSILDLIFNEGVYTNKFMLSF